MGAWIHRLTNVDPRRKTAVCEKCGPVSIVRRAENRNGVTWRCRTAKLGIVPEILRLRKFVRGATLENVSLVTPVALDFAKLTFGVPEELEVAAVFDSDAMGDLYPMEFVPGETVRRMTRFDLKKTPRTPLLALVKRRK